MGIVLFRDPDQREARKAVLQNRKRLAVLFLDGVKIDDDDGELIASLAWNGILERGEAMDLESLVGFQQGLEFSR